MSDKSTSSENKGEDYRAVIDTEKCTVSGDHVLRNHL